MKNIKYYQEMKNREKQARQDALSRLAGLNHYQDSHETNLYRLFLIRCAIFTAAAIPLTIYLISALNQSA